MCSAVIWVREVQRAFVLIMACLMIGIGFLPAFADPDCPHIFQDSGDISGMVAMPGNTPAEQRFLIVRDLKDNCSQKDKSRAGVLTITNNQKGSVVPVEIPVDGWQGQTSNDLEAVCAVPDKPDTYLLMESGYRGESYGRVFVVRIDEQGGGYKGSVIGIFKLPTEDKSYNLEGMISFKWKGAPYLIFADRGNYAAHLATKKDGNAQPIGNGGSMLFLAKLPDSMNSTIQWEPLVKKPLKAPTFEGESNEEFRHCSALCLMKAPSPQKNSFQVWASADHDTGNKGPFYSRVWCAGTLNPDAASKEEIFIPLANPNPIWLCDKIKIEALAVALADKPTLCFGTDDEDYGGKWGLLPMLSLPLVNRP